MIRVLFFARLREQLGVGEITCAAAGLNNLADLIAHLLQLHPQWREFLTRPNVLMAINREYAKVDAPLKAGDEVAFFPPVTGG